MDQQAKITDSEKQLIVSTMVHEYERLCSEIRTNMRNAVSGIAFLAAITAAVVIAAFNKWEEPVVPAFLLSMGLPFVVLGTVLIIYLFVQDINYKVRYIKNVLEKRVNELLGPSLQAWVEKQLVTDKAEHRTQQLSADLSGPPWDSMRHKIWAWDSWCDSESCKKTFKGEFRLQRLLWCITFSVIIVIPVVGILLSVVFHSGWAVPLTDPHRLILLIVGFLILSLAAFCGLLAGFKLRFFAK